MSIFSRMGVVQLSLSFSPEMFVHCRWDEVAAHAVPDKSLILPLRHEEG